MVARGLEVKPGSFGAAYHETNLIVAAMDSAFAKDGRTGWVGTWNFTLTKKDADAVYAYWVRAVNNPHLTDGKDPEARFFFSRFGVLERGELPLDAGGVHQVVETPIYQCNKSDAVCGKLGAMGARGQKEPLKIRQ